MSLIMIDGDELQLGHAMQIFLRKNNVSQLRVAFDKLIAQVSHPEWEETFTDFRKNGGREIFLRLPDVIKQVGLKRSTIYKKIQRKEFPAPIKVGERSSMWPESKIKAWIASHTETN